jgi:hypothetical protein
MLGMTSEIACNNIPSSKVLINIDKCLNVLACVIENV